MEEELSGGSSEVVSDSLDGANTIKQDMPAPPDPDSGQKLKIPKWVYIVMTIIAVSLITVAVLIVLLKPKSTTKPVSVVTVNTQTLDAGTLTKLSANANPEGVIKQQLTIAPETLFKSNIEIQGSVKVDKDLTVSGGTNLLGSVSTGSSLNVKSALSVGGNTNLGAGLSVAGQITASSLSIGSLSTSSFKLSGDLNVGGHFIPSGTTPTATRGPAASGGSVTITGNDIAGTITITTGSGAVQTGEMANITFHSPYTGTPKVQLTPVNIAAAGLNYYAARSTTFFTLNTITMPAAGTAYSFDYLVTQ